MNQTTINFPFMERRAEDGHEQFEVPAPNRLRDSRLIPLLGTAEERAHATRETGLRMMAQRFGCVPSRSSVFRWRTDGYPVDKDGPRVILPVVRHLKRLYTSPEALTRWFQMIQYLGDQIREAGSVPKWRSGRE